MCFVYLLQICNTALPCLALPSLPLPSLPLPSLPLPSLPFPCLPLPCLALPCLAGRHRCGACSRTRASRCARQWTLRPRCRPPCGSMPPPPPLPPAMLGQAVGIARADNRTPTRPPRVLVGAVSPCGEVRLLLAVVLLPPGRGQGQSLLRAGWAHSP
jgi:hypothetical protein